MTTAVIVVLVLLVAFMLFGVPVGFAIGGATMAAMWFCSDLNMVVNAQYCYSGIFSFTVMAIRSSCWRASSCPPAALPAASWISLRR